jgi:cysteine desulfurase
MIYLDYSANTPVDARVLEQFCAVERRCIGNANSHHQAGSAAKAEIDTATIKIASLLGVQPAEIIYTSGASEANNFALKGLARLSRHAGRHIISTPLEHSSVSGTLTALQEQGYEIDLLDVKQDGTVDLEHLKDLLRPDTICVAVTLVDSELGVVQPVQEIAAILKTYPHCHLHVDATQAVGKIPVSFEGVDTISLTAHKFYGLNGIGMLIKRRNLALEPLIHGGESTTIYRSGTPTVALASSLACALDLAVTDLPGRVGHVTKLNAELRAALSTYPLVRINSPEHAIPHVLNLSVRNVKGTVFQRELDAQGVCVSVKSACSSNGLRVRCLRSAATAATHCPPGASA